MEQSFSVVVSPAAYLSLEILQSRYDADLCDTILHILLLTSLWGQTCMQVRVVMLLTFAPLKDMCDISGLPASRWTKTEMILSPIAM